MDRHIAEQKAIEILKQVVDALADERYDDIAELAELGVWPPEKLRDIMKEYLQVCGNHHFSHIDHWSEERTVSSLNQSYAQLTFYHFNNGSGFHVDYDLTTDGKLNDLTLQMEFLYEGEGLRAVFLDVHVM